MSSFLDRERSIAPEGYNRWLAPPAALAIHLSIGQVYAFSVFKNPLLALHGADGSAWNLKDLFGGYNVPAIHGRLLTAWSTAGIVGPLIVNGILDHYVEQHLSKQAAYPVILHIMTRLLLVGLAANALVRPVADRYWMREQVGAVADAGH